MADKQFVPLSFEMINKICNEGLTGGEIKTLLQILKTFNGNTGIGFPSLGYIAKKAHVDRSTVSEAVQSLSKKGFLLYKKGGSIGGNQANQYYLPENLKANLKATTATEDDYDAEELRRKLESGELR